MRDLLRGSRTPWLASPLIAIASLASLWGLSSMVELGRWMTTSALILALVCLAVVATRVLSRSRVLPTIIGTAAAVLTLVPAYARTAEGAAHWLPTPSSLQALGRALADGSAYANETAAPAVVTTDLAALLTSLVLLLFLLCENLAVSWRGVATAGIALLIPWVPAMLLQHRVSALALFVALGAWIAAMTIARRTGNADRGPSLGSGAVALTATLLAVAVVAPTALGGAGWGFIPRFDASGILDAPTRLNLELDLRDSLTVNSRRPVMAYHTSDAKPPALRLYTLSSFNGNAWEGGTEPSGTRPAGQGVLWPEAVEGWEGAERTRLDVVVLSLSERNLPLPPAPRLVEAPGPWNYDAATDVVYAEQATTLDLQYTVVTDLGYHDAAGLRRAARAVAADPALDLADPAYTAVPPSVDLPRIRSLAEEVTEDASDRYSQAVAIQGYLRNTSVFTYDTTVALAGGDAVSSFLDNRSGFCLHFATTMVMMARSLGIPARLAVGFLPGRLDSEGTYLVSGADAHAWAEVYFPGQGWVRFEPTPSVQTGAAPSYADPLAGQVPVPREVLEGGQQIAPPLPGEPVEGPGAPEEPAEAAGGPPLWAIIAAALALVAAAAAAAAWWRRRAVHHLHHASGPEAAWERLARELQETRWPTSATPGEAAEHIMWVHRTTGERMPAAAAEALWSLAMAVMDQRYSPFGTTVTRIEAEGWAQQVIDAMGEATGRPTRGASRSAAPAGP